MRRKEAYDEWWGKLILLGLKRNEIKASIFWERLELSREMLRQTASFNSQLFLFQEQWVLSVWRQGPGKDDQTRRYRVRAKSHNFLKYNCSTVSRRCGKGHQIIKISCLWKARQCFWVTWRLSNWEPSAIRKKFKQCLREKLSQEQDPPVIPLFAQSV